GSRARRLPFLERREDPERRITLDLQVRVYAAELGADRRVFEQRPAPPLERADRTEQLMERGRVARHAGERAAAPLVGDGRLRDLPTLRESTDEVRLLDSGIGHEHFC